MMLGAEFPAALDVNRRHEHGAASEPGIGAIHRRHSGHSMGRGDIEQRARGILGRQGGSILPLSNGASLHFVGDIDLTAASFTVGTA